jgi:ParB family chromosome partitioning protein
MVEIPLSQIAISLQDRQAFLNTEQDIADLAAKIKAEGLIQPVVLEADGQGQFRVIAGHMRVEACKRLGWRSVPAIIREPA